jgi:hypothetical protein
MSRKAHAFGCKLIDMGRPDDRLPVTAKIAVTQVIGKDVNDIGLGIVLFAGMRTSGNPYDTGKNQVFGFHEKILNKSSTLLK